MHHRQMQRVENDYCSTSSWTSSIVRASSNPSISSMIGSMCPISIDASNYPLKHDNQPITETSLTKNSLVNTSLCKICNKFNTTNQYDTCLQCYQNQSKSNSFENISIEQKSHNQTVLSQSFHVQKTMDNDKNKLLENNNTTDVADSSQDEAKKKLQHHVLKHLVIFNGECESLRDLSKRSSSLSSQSCLFQLVVRPKLCFEENVVETIECSPSVLASVPVSEPVSQCLHLSSEDINYYKKREVELHHTVTELIEQLTIKTNENINQISKYWSYLKQLSLNNIQPQTNLNQIFNYLSKPINRNKQFEHFLEKNDEIKALLRVLSTTLDIVQDRYSLSTINQLFDCEEKTMIENLRTELEFSVSSHTDELSMINLFSDFHQTSLKELDNFHLIKIIKNDYPSLIEKISNDFVTKVPQVNEILEKMLRNVKNNLLCNNFETNNKRDIE
ncbi:unnamed protein product [Rotaria sp. Silwood2]|nr:unnamed protein product [Rotaria sp. Silwood2]